MIEYERKALQGVPDYRAAELLPKRSEYCLLIPVINEGARILTELGRAQTAGVDTLCDIVICDGGSTDGSMKLDTLQLYGVNTLLTKTGPGKQGAQLRMGIYFALNRGYKGVLTIDGNNKDSIEDVHKFIEKLQAGYDFVQGSRFIRGGHAVNTPPVRYAAWPGRSCWGCGHHRAACPKDRPRGHGQCHGRGRWRQSCRRVGSPPGQAAPPAGGVPYCQCEPHRPYGCWTVPS